MDKLRSELNRLFLKELADLQIGYSFNTTRIQEMKTLIHAMFYIEYGDLTNAEALRVIEKIID